MSSEGSKSRQRIDLAVLMLGVIALEALSLIFSFYAIFTVFHGQPSKVNLEYMLNWFKENLLYTGYSIVIGQIIATGLRFAITRHFAKKYSVSFKLKLPKIVDFAPIVAVAIVLEAIIMPLLGV